jgi:hypothetical protein
MPVIRFRGLATSPTSPILARVLMAALLVTIGGGVAAESPATLIVRLYNTVAIPPDEFAAARNTADAILRDTGLDVMFRQCGSATDSCDEPLARSEVVVRIINAPPFNATLEPDAFGLTYIVKSTNRGWLATVFADRIGGAATRVGVEPGTLLGRVMAHEIGHLLLGVDYHGSAGVMRAAWPDGALNRDANDWRFSMIEAERLHRIVASL